MCSASLTLGEWSQKCNNIYNLCRESLNSSIQSTKGRNRKKDWGQRGIEQRISWEDEQKKSERLCLQLDEKGNL